LQRAAC